LTCRLTVGWLVLVDLRSAVERFGLGHGKKDPKFAPELSAQNVFVVERAAVECLLFLVECIHGFSAIR
jgi:hypothetical protein